MMVESHFTLVQILVRLMAALGAGAVIGIDREWRQKSAGLRTHMLFSLACGALSMMAIEVYLSEVDSGKDHSPDATRILQGVITGMSFLGAGAILHHQQRIRGLTTGAGVWLSGALGLVFGLGLFVLGAVALGLGFATLTIMRLAEPPEERKSTVKQEKS